MKGRSTGKAENHCLKDSLLAAQIHTEFSGQLCSGKK